MVEEKGEKEANGPSDAIIHQCPNCNFSTNHQPVLHVHIIIKHGQPSTSSQCESSLKDSFVRVETGEGNDSEVESSRSDLKENEPDNISPEALTKNQSQQWGVPQQRHYTLAFKQRVVNVQGETKRVKNSSLFMATAEKLGKNMKSPLHHQGTTVLQLHQWQFQTPFSQLNSFHFLN